MLKALTAAVAITVCCLGNDYPAKSHHEHFGDGVLNRRTGNTWAMDAAANNFVRMGEEAYQRHRLRQIIREELR